MNTFLYLTASTSLISPPPRSPSAKPVRLYRAKLPPDEPLELPLEDEDEPDDDEELEDEELDEDELLLEEEELEPLEELELLLEDEELEEDEELDDPGAAPSLSLAPRSVPPGTPVSIKSLPCANKRNDPRPNEPLADRAI